MPLVTVWSKPKGLPMATTFWPTCRSLDIPIATGASPLTGSESLRTAMSLVGSRPTSVASTWRWSGRLTMYLTPSSMTWKLVTMWPRSSQTKPEPLPRGTSSSEVKKKSLRYCRLVMKTTEFLVLRTTSIVFCSSSVRRGFATVWPGAAEGAV